MTTYTLRPTGYPTWAGATTPGTPTTTLNDNNDATVFQFTGVGVSYVTAALTNLSALAAGEQIASVAVRVRFASGSGVTSTAVRLKDSGGILSAADYWAVNHAGGQTTLTGAKRTTAPDGGAWTEAKVNGLSVDVRDDGYGSTKPAISEVYVDVVTTSAPVPAFTAPTHGATITDTQKPTFTWSFTDADGDVQAAYRVAVYTAAVFGQPYFDPSIIGPGYPIPVADSGVVESGDQTWQCNVALANDTYMTFVHVRDSSGVWSVVNYGGPFVTVILSVKNPGASEIFASADPTNSRITLSLQDYQNMLSADDAGFEGSAGSWVPHYGASGVSTGRAAVASHGGYGYRIHSSSSDFSYARTGINLYSIVGGTAYAGGFWAKASSVTNRSARCEVWFFDAGGNLIGSAVSSPVTISQSAYAFVGATNTAPALATHAALVAIGIAIPVGESVYIDEAALKAGSSLGRVSVWSPGGLLSAARFEVQRSIDGGDNWVTLDRLYLSGVGVLDPAVLDYNDLNQGQVLYDYEAPHGEQVSYRVRTVANETASLWYEDLPVTLPIAGWSLKSLTDPTTNIRIHVHSSDFVLKSTESQGVFRPLGRPNSVVLADVVGGETGDMALAFLDQASYDAFEVLRDRQETLLLQSPYGHHLYIRLGAERSAGFRLNNGGVAKRVVNVSFVEVDP